MTPIQKTSIVGGLLLFGLALPRSSFGITGCTNAYLTGTYNAQVQSVNFMNVLNQLNATAAASNSGNGSGTGSGTGSSGSSGSGGSTGSSGSGGSTGGSSSGGGTGFFGGSSGFGSGSINDTGGGTTGGTMGGTTGGTTGGTSTGTSGGTTGAAAVTPFTGGFGDTTSSLAGKVPGLGRFFFDGQGNIIGLSSDGNQSVGVGSYSVNTDCSATIKLNNGASFNAVLAANGAQVLFIENDTAGLGAIGELDRSTAACIANVSPQSFAFSFFGAQQASSAGGTGSGGTNSGGIAGNPGNGSTTGTVGTGGSTSTGTTVANVSFQPTGGIGSVTLDGQGGFSMVEWALTGGAVKTVRASGTYTINTDCTIRLTFTSNPNGGTTGAVGTPPTVFRGLLNGNSGLVILQPDNVAFDVIPGSFIAQ